MMGSKYSDAQREQALAMLVGGMSVTRVAAAMKIPKATISDWKRRAESDDEDFVAARREEREKLVAQSFKIVRKGLAGVEKQIGAAAREKAEVDKVILRILGDGGIDEQTRDMMVKIVRDYSGVGLGELTRATKDIFGMHEQLAAGLDEQSAGVQITFESGEDLAG